MKKLLVRLAVLSVLAFFSIRASDALVMKAYTMELKNVQAATNIDMQRQIDSQTAEMKELRSAWDRTNSNMETLRIDFAELKAKFAVIYGILAVIGGAIGVQIVQRYAGERRK